MSGGFFIGNSARAVQKTRGYCWRTPKSRELGYLGSANLWGACEETPVLKIGSPTVSEGFRYYCPD